MDIGKIKSDMKVMEGILDEGERKALGLSERPTHIMEGMANKAEMTEETGSVNFIPLQRLQDKKTLRPFQGKESDGELIFNFESIRDAQSLHDFIVNTALLEPGEVMLYSAEDQHSVHFAPHVAVIKPDVIQAAMMAYFDQLGGDYEDAYEELSDALADVMDEARSQPSLAEIKRGLKSGAYEMAGETDGPGGQKYYVIRDIKGKSEFQVPKNKASKWLAKYEDPDDLDEADLTEARKIEVRNAPKGWSPRNPFHDKKTGKFLKIGGKNKKIVISFGAVKKVPKMKIEDIAIWNDKYIDGIKLAKAIRKYVNGEEIAEVNAEEMVGAIKNIEHRAIEITARHKED